MITYLKMKRNEIKIKSAFYRMIVDIIDNQKDILNLFKKLYLALKDVPADELKTEFIKELAEIVHDESKKASN